MHAGIWLAAESDGAPDAKSASASNAYTPAKKPVLKDLNDIHPHCPTCGGDFESPKNKAMINLQPKKEPS
jgi:hypothetical protein